MKHSRIVRSRMFWDETRAKAAVTIFGTHRIQLPHNTPIAPLTERQQECLQYMAHFASATGVAAGLRDVAFGLGIQIQAAFDLIRGIEKRNVVGGAAYEKRHKALLVNGYDQAVRARANGHEFCSDGPLLSCRNCGAVEGTDPFQSICTRRDDAK